MTAKILTKEYLVLQGRFFCTKTETSNIIMKKISDLIIMPLIADWPDIEGFTWEEYLVKTKSSPVPARAFKNVSAVNV